MIRRPPRSTRVRSSAASDVYKRQASNDGRRGRLVPETARHAVADVVPRRRHDEVARRRRYLERRPFVSQRTGGTGSTVVVAVARKHSPCGATVHPVVAVRLAASSWFVDRRRQRALRRGCPGDSGTVGGAWSAAAACARDVDADVAPDSGVDNGGRRCTRRQTDRRRTAIPASACTRRTAALPPPADLPSHRRHHSFGALSK